MFDNVSRATTLEHEIQELWAQYCKARDMRDAYHQNRDRHNAGLMNQRMNSIVLDANYAQIQWKAETGKQWRMDYYKLPAPDDVMEAAFNALADNLACQDLKLLQEVKELWDVWEYIKENGGGITRPAVIVFPDDEIAETKRFEYFDNGRTNANVHAAAAWVRKQGGK